jgi:hypothetical protein
VAGATGASVLKFSYGMDFACREDTRSLTDAVVGWMGLTGKAVSSGERSLKPDQESSQRAERTRNQVGGYREVVQTLDVQLPVQRGRWLI